MELAVLYAYSYLIGAVPTAYIIGKLVRGIDIREFGSGNAGGSNVFYSVGKSWTIPLGLFEVFVKGGSPVWIGLYVLDLGKILGGIDRCSPLGHRRAQLVSVPQVHRGPGNCGGFRSVAGFGIS